jgi:leucyl-tRNA synthetase
VTCEPDYYKHNQIIFLKLLENGLAYQDEAIVNWDPVDCTVLANEQVDANGFSWRSGAKVEQRLLKQWFLKITDFAEELHSDLSNLNKSPWIWPENVLRMQKNWLKKSEGDKLIFKVQGLDTSSLNESITVFTTRLDTIFGVQYIALASDHPIVKVVAEKDPALKDYLENCQQEISPQSGYRLEGITAISPLQSIAIDSKPLPVFVAPYVIPGYGTGSVMGVPAHDERDSIFWNLNGNGDPPFHVISPDPKLNPGQNDNGLSDSFTEWGYLNHNCGKYQGLHTSNALEKLRADLATENCVEKVTMWGLRDWLISRQRYWGTPIPIVHCDGCGAVPVPLNDLPVILPPLPAGSFKGRGGNPLDQIPEWVNTECPKCGQAAKRETDTMDTFMDSSWYFFRFTDAHNKEIPFSPEKAQMSMPVNFYIGGVEHAILHLLYARFLTKFFAKVNMWKPEQLAEPFQRLITQGMVHGRTYSDPETGRFLKSDEVDILDPSKPIIKATGAQPKITFEKMSKSKYNGVDPQSCIVKYGADATRAHILFQANEMEVLEWNEQPIVGIIRSSLSRQGPLAHNTLSVNPDSKFPKEKYSTVEYDLLQATRIAIANITPKLETINSLNTVVSDLLKLSNALDTAASHLGSSSTTEQSTNIVSAAIFHRCTSVMIRLMAPIVPAWAEEAWHALQGFPAGETTAPEQARSVFEEPWPQEHEVSVEGARHDSEIVVLMVNGRRSGETTIPCPPENLVAHGEGSNEKGLSKELNDWYLKEVFENTEKGQQVWSKHGEKVKKTIIVRLSGEKKGVVINLAVPKKKT